MLTMTEIAGRINIMVIGVEMTGILPLTKITQQRNIALLNTSHMLLNRMIPPKTMMR